MLKAYVDHLEKCSVAANQHPNVASRPNQANEETNLDHVKITEEVSKYATKYSQEWRRWQNVLKRILI